MKVYRIDQIKFEPLDVIARDYDHAARIFLVQLSVGLENIPRVDFAVNEWSHERLQRYAGPLQWTKEGKSGMIWPFEDGPGWELISTNVD